MKKILLSLALLAGMSLAAQAQQLANSTFDDTWEKCYPWEGNEKSKTAQGTQPTGWCIANVCGMNAGILGYLGATIVGDQVTGRTGSGKAVQLTNTPNPLSSNQIVPGYMSLGTTWATAKATLNGSVTAGTADGGSFGGKPFTYHPDAIHLYYKRAHNVKNKTNVVNLNEKASIIAYTWKGTWTQENVPQTTSMSDPDKYPMIDRDRNVLFNATGTVGSLDDISCEEGELIASIEYYIEGDASEWTELTIPFTYNTSSTPEKLNIIIAAEDYFADRSVIGNGNQITVDDIILLYYCELESATYDGVELEFDGTDAFVDKVYDEDLLELKSNGHGAIFEKIYDEETAELRIIVYSEDYSDYNSYSIQFKKPILLGDVNGDKLITIADVTALLNIILEKKGENEAADVNGDHSVTIADVTALVNIILKKNNE